jgi:Tol biopolymer transport system component
VSAQVWTGPGARVIGGPAVDRDGRLIAFSVEQGGRTVLYVMHADGTNVRAVTAAHDLRGAPVWVPGRPLITAAVAVDGHPRLFNISLEGALTPLISEFSVEPAWDAGGTVVAYSGADIGTRYPVKAVFHDSGREALPALAVTRGARRLRFLDMPRALAMLRGDLQHEDVWLVDLDRGTERRLTSLPPGFLIRDFDLSPDGSELVVERVQHRSDIGLIEVPAP